MSSPWGSAVAIAAATCAALVVLIDGGSSDPHTGLPPRLLVVPAVAALPLFTSSSSSSPARRGGSAARATRPHPSRPTELASSPSSASLPVYFDSTNHRHRDLSYHPENPERIAACVRALASAFPPATNDDNESDDVVRLVDVAAEPDPPSSYLVKKASFMVSGGSDDLPHRESTIRHRPFSADELGHARQMLVEAHSEDLVSDLEGRCEAAKQRRAEQGREDLLGHMGYLNGDPDCYVTTDSYAVCLRAAASWIRAANDALGGSAAIATTTASGSLGAAVALVRPPGHHATRTLQNGFCLFNFAAAAALAVLSRDPEAKVSVLDWDVHYGQGTADILGSHPRARYASVHQIPAFPYRGERLEVAGEYDNVYTVPVPPSTTWACGYSDAYEKALRFCFEPGVWEPDLVIVSAGFDALDSDPLATVSLQAGDFGTMTTMLCRHVSSASGKRVAIVVGLEGGYQLEEMAGGGNLQEAVVATIRAILETRRSDDSSRLPNRQHEASIESPTGNS